MAYKNKVTLGLGISKHLNEILTLECELQGSSKAQIILNIVNDYYKNTLIKNYIKLKENKKIINNQFGDSKYSMSKYEDTNNE